MNSDVWLLSYLIVFYVFLQYMYILYDLKLRLCSVFWKNSVCFVPRDKKVLTLLTLGLGVLSLGIRN